MRVNTKKQTLKRWQDKAWKQLNKDLQNFIKSNDFYSIGSTYYEMANFVKNEGKDNTRLLELAYKIRLKFQTDKLNEYKKSEVCTAVEVIVVTNSDENNSCDECKRLDGKIFSIDEALSKNILPVKNCSHKYGCRCAYGPDISN